MRMKWAPTFKTQPTEIAGTQKRPALSNAATIGLALTKLQSVGLQRERTTCPPIRSFIVLGIAVLATSCQWDRHVGNSHTRIDRGVTGLELGMSLEQAEKSFKLQEKQNPVLSLLAQVGVKSTSGEEEMIAVDKLLGKRFFNIAPGIEQLPINVQSVDVTFAKNVLYHIGLHYPPQYVEKVGWQSITFACVGRYGKPRQDHGSSYSWEDDQTRFDVQLSGEAASLFYTDLALEYEVEKYQATAQDIQRQQRRAGIPPDK